MYQRPNLNQLARDARSNPAARAVVLTSSNNRRGRSDPRNRLRIPTSTVG
jgi:hypothetical protein